LANPREYLRDSPTSRSSALIFTLGLHLLIFFAMIWVKIDIDASQKGNTVPQKTDDNTKLQNIELETQPIEDRLLNKNEDILKSIKTAISQDSSRSLFSKLKDKPSIPDFMRGSFDQNKTPNKSEEKVVKQSPSNEKIYSTNIFTAILQSADWDWLLKPEINDQSGEHGMIEFDILIDQNGNMIEATAVKWTVNAPLVRLYEKGLQQTRYYATPNHSVNGNTKSKVVFKIR
jgi:hypothetical protein